MVNLFRRCCLLGISSKNDCVSWFWDSIQAKKEGSSKPTAYSVLACLDYAGDTEEDVVDSATDMGLNLRQGLGYLEEQRNIRAFFLPSEREALNSIR